MGATSLRGNQVSAASESQRGTAEIATTAEALGHADDARMITALKMDQRFDPRRRAVIYGEFTNNDAPPGLANVSSGSGAGIGGGTSAMVANSVGVASYFTGTTTTGRAGFHNNQQVNQFYLGGGEARFGARVCFSALWTGTEDGTTRIGFIDSVSAEPTDGIYFRCTSTVNSGNWQLVARKGNTETVINTNIAPTVQATWQRLEFIVNADASSVEGFIDGASIGTITTNIPNTATNLNGWGANIFKSAGTTSIAMYLDYFWTEIIFTTAR